MKGDTHREGESEKTEAAASMILNVRLSLSFFFPSSLFFVLPFCLALLSLHSSEGEKEKTDRLSYDLRFYHRFGSNDDECLLTRYANYVVGIEFKDRVRPWLVTESIVVEH